MAEFLGTIAAAFAIIAGLYGGWRWIRRTIRRRRGKTATVQRSEPRAPKLTPEEEQVLVGAYHASDQKILTFKEAVEPSPIDSLLERETYGAVRVRAGDAVLGDEASDKTRIADAVLKLERKGYLKTLRAAFGSGPNLREYELTLAGRDAARVLIDAQSTS